MTDAEQYVLGYRHVEQERLVLQARQLAHESTTLFDEIGVGAGWHVVELGCGPQGCLDLLGERVGPSGSVVGIERSQEAVDLARQMLEKRHLSHVRVHCRDARACGLDRAAFDLVTARLVLVNVPEPEQIVAEAVSLVRPGGCVAFHEADWLGHVCDPPSDDWDAIVEMFVAYSRRNGIDPFVGRKLPRLLRQAGLVDIQVTPLLHVYPPGHERRTILLDFAENVTERLVEQGFADAQRMADLKDGLRQHLADPNTLVVSHLFFQSWGRRPN